MLSPCRPPRCCQLNPQGFFTVLLQGIWQTGTGLLLHLVSDLLSNHPLDALCASFPNENGGRVGMGACSQHAPIPAFVVERHSPA